MVKQNGTFTSENGAQLTIANSYASFSFPKDIPQTFFVEEAVEEPIHFELQVAEMLTLYILYEKQEQN